MKISPNHKTLMKQTHASITLKELTKPIGVLPRKVFGLNKYNLCKTQCGILVKLLLYTVYPKKRVFCMFYFGLPLLSYM